MLNYMFSSGRLLTLAVFTSCVLWACGGSSPDPAPGGANQQQLTATPAPVVADTEEPAEPETPATEAEPTTPDEPSEPPTPVLPAPNQGTPITLKPVLSGFSGSYREPPVKLPAAFSDPSLELPIDLADVAHLAHYDLTADQQSMLTQYGFVVAPTTYSEHHSVYKQTADGYDVERPVYVTCDSLLHIYHLLYDKLLRDLEEQQFAPLLEDLTRELTRTAATQYTQATGSSLAEPARHTWAYFAVAEQLIMDSPPAVPTAIADLVNPELELIAKHAGPSSSPVLSLGLGYQEDYSQYVPRGHYTRTALRQRYFKTMMWYGRMNMRLMDPQETLIALLVTRALHQTSVHDAPAVRAWSALHDPIAFLVGNADDLGLREYSALIPEIYGTELDLAELADTELLSEFIAAGSALPPPQINSMLVLNDPVVPQTQGFRFMGQRFVLDGYIFTQLISTKVTGRGLPNSLDVLAAFGSQEAHDILAELGETAYPEYESQLNKLKSAISDMDEEDWSQNVYFNWLYALQAMLAPRGASYPPYMRTEPWARKDLHSALGSWAELKHDTILYAKQPYTVGTAAPLDAPPVQHNVEPCPLLYARLQALALMTREGLGTIGTPNIAVDNLLSELIEKLSFAQDIAEKQLAGELLTEAESKTLKHFGGWLERMIDRSADRPAEPDPEFGEYAEKANEPAAIIADVATDLMFTMKVLEVGTGHVYEIYVITPDGQAGLQLARGAVYSFYEFPWDPGDRLTDEVWREMLATGMAPEQPAWTTSFIK